jgi:UDP-N-acetylglucosamine 3-dehydrogenase
VTRRLRVGIVGYDHPHVLRFAPMLAAHPGVDLAWISADGPNLAVATEMARQLGVPLLPEPGDGIDAAYLATRPGRHLDTVRRLAPAGVHLLCDKPIALTLDEGRAIVEEARRAGVHLMVPFNPRGQDGPRAVKARIDAGELGDIQLVHAVKMGKVPLSIPGLDTSWFIDPAEAGFGGFGDIGIHALDALRWLIGREATRVYARIHRGPHAELPVDSIGTATIEFDGGAIATLTAGWANPDGYPSFLDARFEVVGTAGAALIEHPYQDLWVADAAKTERIAARRADAIWNIDAFVRSVLDDVPPPITGEDGVRALELLLACYRSADIGEAVAIT